MYNIGGTWEKKGKGSNKRHQDIYKVNIFCIKVHGPNQRIALSKQYKFQSLMI